MRHKLSTQPISLSEDSMVDILQKIEVLETRCQWFIAGEGYFAFAKSLTNNQIQAIEITKVFVRLFFVFHAKTNLPLGLGIVRPSSLAVSIHS